MLDGVNANPERGAETLVIPVVVLMSCPAQRCAVMAAQLMLDGVDARPAAAHRLSASRLLHGLRWGAKTLVAPVIIVMILTL